MDEFLNQIFIILGIGGIGGFVLGYTVKKILKILIVIIGIYILSLLYLISVDVIKINWGNLVGTALNLGEQATDFLSSIGAFLPLSGSFVMGFTFGLIKG